MGNGGNTKLQSTIPPSSLFPQRGGWAQERAWPVERMMHLSGMRRGTMWLWVGLLALAGCKASSAPPKDEKTVTIFVAASTKEAVEKLAKDFTAETGIKVEVSPGPSSGLAKQIEQGAPADLFLSADQPMADYLAGKPARPGNADTERRHSYKPCRAPVSTEAELLQKIRKYQQNSFDPILRII